MRCAFGVKGTPPFYLKQIDFAIWEQIRPKKTLSLSWSVFFVEKTKKSLEKYKPEKSLVRKKKNVMKSIRSTSLHLVHTKKYKKKLEEKNQTSSYV